MWKVPADRDCLFKMLLKTQLLYKNPASFLSLLLQKELENMAETLKKCPFVTTTSLTHVFKWLVLEIL